MLCIALAASASLATQPVDCGELVYLGEVSGTPTSVQVVGELAYSVEGRNGLAITNLAEDPLNPVAYFDLDLLATHIQISGDVAVLSRGGHQPVLVDLTDPFHPAPAGAIPEALGNQADALWLDENLLLLNRADGTVALYDVADPHHPSEVSTIHAEAGQRVTACAIENGHLYAFGGAGGSWSVRVYDVSDPASPSLVSELGIPGRPRDLVVRDGLLAVLIIGNHDAVLLDVSDPSAPTPLTLNGPLQNLGAAAVAPGGNVLVAYQGDRMHIVVRSPNDQFDVLSSGWRFHGPQFRFSETDQTVFVKHNFGLTSLDIRSPSEPTAEWLRPSLNQPWAVRSLNSALLVTTGVGAITIDASDPESMKVLSAPRRAAPNPAAEIIVDRARSLAFEIGPRLYALDTSDPANPVDLSSAGGLSSVYAHTRSGPTLFLSGVGDARSTPAIVTTDPYDIHDDTSISPGYAWHPTFLHAEDGVLYADARDLHIYDVTAPPATPQTGYFDLSPIERIAAVHDGVVYTTVPGELHTIDASDHAGIHRLPNPQPGPNAGHDVALVRGDKLYVLGDALYVYDVTEPGRPDLVTTLDTTDLLGADDVTITDFDVDADRLYLTVSGRSGSRRPDAVVAARLPNCAVACPADLSLPDGTLDAADLTAFTQLVLASRERADWNLDGRTDLFDLIAFIEDLSSGCP